MALNKPDKPKESSDLSKFNINRLTTDAGLVEFAKLAQNASQNDLKKWGKTTITTQPGGASFGDTSYSDYLHRRLGIKGNEINNTTINALEKIAESGKITRIPYTTQTKGKEVQQVRTVEKPLSQTEARTYLLQFTDGKGEISKSGRVAWAKLDFDTRTKLQRSVNAYVDGKIGRDTIDALKARTDGKEYQTTLKLDNLKQQIAGTEKTMQDLQSAGIQVGEASTTVPSSETTTSTVADTKATTSETFIDTPEKQATRKLIEEAEAARLAQNTPAVRATIQEATPVKTADVVSQASATEAQKVETMVIPTTTRATPTTTEGQNLDQRYQSELKEVAEKFDPSKYTYISYEYETEGDDKKKSKKTEVVQVNNQAFAAAGIDPNKENAYKILHIIQVGALTMSDWFKNVDTIDAKLVPPQTSGNGRIDYINTLLTQANQPRIELQTFKDANKYLGSLSRTASLGFWTAAQEGIKQDKRKDNQQDIEKKFSKASQRLIDTNNSENLAQYYTELFADAKNMSELEILAERDALLRSIIEDPGLGLKQEKTKSKFGSFTEGTQLKALQRDISGGGRRKDFETIIKQNIETQRDNGFIFRNGTLMIDDSAIQAAASGDGIIKGNSLNKKGESVDVYLSVHALPSGTTIPGFDGASKEKLRDKTISVDIDGAKDVQLYIGKNDAIYLINSPKNIGMVSQMFTSAGDIIQNDTTQKVLIAVGASLVTLAATDNLSWNIGTPNIPRISGHGISTQSPDISANLNNAATGYVATALVLNAALTDTQAKLRNEKQYDEAMKTLATIAKNNSPEAFERLKKYYLEKGGM